jgi:putative tricarboxylic transport membrane protein
MISERKAHSRLNNADLFCGLLGLALGGFVIWSGLQLRLGSINDPGSGFVMFYTGLLMCVFAVAILWSAVTEGGATFGSLWAEAQWSKPAVIIASLVAFALALEPLGFLLSTIPLMLILLRAVDPVRWTLAIPLAVLAPLGAWWVLKRGLAIQLPSGLFGIG